MVALPVMPHVFNVACPTFQNVESYGHVACALVDGLRQRGFSVNEIGSGARTTRMTPVPGGFLLGYPTIYKEYGVLPNYGKRVAITMFESTRLPDGWAGALNQCNAVIVPAQFLVEVFRNEGVIVPIHVVPLGIDAEYMQVKRRYTPRKTPFTVLAIADRGNRKNWAGAAFAFIKAFGDDPHFRLILKARRNAFPEGWGITNSNIEVIQADYTEAQMAALYRRCHVMLFPARGEGFGLPPREFAATGGIVLATNWGGTADDLDCWGMPIPYTLETAWTGHDHWFGQLGEWANPNVGDLATQLQTIAGDYRPYARQAMHAAQFVRDTYTWDKFVEGCLAVYASL